jgi:uncharacterized cupredoxin-like copper-binding protein
MATTTRHPLAITALVALLAVAGVLLADTVRSREQPRSEVEIVLGEYGIEPTSVAVPAGEPLTLTFTNTATAARDVGFGRDVVEQDGRPVAYAEDLLEGLEVRVDPVSARSVAPDGARVFTVAPGRAVTLRFEVPVDRAGEWELGCFSSRGCHYVAGLHATLVVEP